MIYNNNIDITGDSPESKQFNIYCYKTQLKSIQKSNLIHFVDVIE